MPRHLLATTDSHPRYLSARNSLARSRERADILGAAKKSKSWGRYHASLRLFPNRALLATAALFSISTLCLAQETRGSITGKVTDP